MQRLMSKLYESESETVACSERLGYLIHAEAKVPGCIDLYDRVCQFR